MTDFDNRPAIIRFVEKVNRAVGKPMDSGTPEPRRHITVHVEHHPQAVDSQDRPRMEIAARYALGTYPGLLAISARIHARPTSRRIGSAVL